MLPSGRSPTRALSQSAPPLGGCVPGCLWGHALGLWLPSMNPTRPVGLAGNDAGHSLKLVGLWHQNAPPLPTSLNSACQGAVCSQQTPNLHFSHPLTTPNCLKAGSQAHPGDRKGGLHPAWGAILYPGGGGACPLKSSRMREGWRCQKWWLGPRQAILRFVPHSPSHLPLGSGAGGEGGEVFGSHPCSGCQGRRCPSQPPSSPADGWAWFPRAPEVP